MATTGGANELGEDDFFDDDEPTKEDGANEEEDVSRTRHLSGLWM